MMFLAGMQAIPSEQYEAAALDGANVFRRFSDITLPSLRPGDHHHRAPLHHLDRQQHQLHLRPDPRRPGRRHDDLPDAGLRGRHRRGPAARPGRRRLGPLLPALHRRHLHPDQANALGGREGVNVGAVVSRQHSRTDASSHRCSHGHAVVDSRPGSCARASATIVLFAGLTIFTIWTLFPFLWILATSIKPDRDLYRKVSLWPATITDAHYIEVLFETPFLTYFRNSFTGRHRDDGDRDDRRRPRRLRHDPALLPRAHLRRPGHHRHLSDPGGAPLHPALPDRAAAAVLPAMPPAWS